MKRFDVQTRYPDDLSSQTIGLLRWALMALIVVIHTNLVADTGCSGTVYGNLYRWAGNVVWLASPLFFLISGYLFVASDGGFSWQAFTVKCRRRLRTWVAPYLLWNTLFPLTKLSANWLLSHDAGSLAFCTVHLLNAAIVIVFSVLAYLLLRKFLPTVCGWLSGVKMVRGKKERESSKVK